MSCTYHIVVLPKVSYLPLNHTFAIYMNGCYDYYE